MVLFSCLWVSFQSIQNTHRFYVVVIMGQIYNLCSIFCHLFYMSFSLVSIFIIFWQQYNPCSLITQPNHNCIDFCSGAVRWGEFLLHPLKLPWSLMFYLL